MVDGISHGSNEAKEYDHDRQMYVVLRTIREAL